MSLQRILACGTALGTAALLLAHPAAAQSVNSQLKSLQQEMQQLQQQQQAQQARDAAKDDQIRQLQATIQQLQASTQQTNTQVEQVLAKPSSGIANTNVKVTLGGFIEAAGIYRSRNEVSDVGSSFSNLPFKNISPSHESEFRESSRQSRLAVLAQGNADANTALTAYWEMDFLGNGVNSNSGESNSYVLRQRLLYAAVDKKDIGTHFLAGQDWSLAVPFKKGMDNRAENIPLTIDAQYVVGFNWRRDPQVRLVQDIGSWLHVGISAESPQAAFGGANAAGTIVSVAGLGGGGGTLNSLNNYTSDVAPDIIVKVAADPGFGHYEVYGLGRAFRDQGRANQASATSSPADHTRLGGGIGAYASVPAVPGMLDLQASVLAGKGIAQYGSGQLVDLVTTPTGGINPVPEVEALVGAIGHVTPALDTYVYAGTEREFATGAVSVGGTNFGLGNSNIPVNTCFTDIAGTTAACSAQTRSLYEVTAGAWDKVWDGPFGSFRVGLEYEFVLRQAFSGGNGLTGKAFHEVNGPLANDNIIMTSIRYYPF